MNNPNTMKLRAVFAAALLAGLAGCGLLGRVTPGLTPEQTGRLDSMTVNCIAQDGRTIWIGGTEGLVGIDMETDERRYVTPRNSGLPSRVVTSLAVDSLGRLWIGTPRGIAVSGDEDGQTITSRNSGLPGDNVSVLAFRDNGELWVGTADSGLAVLRGDRWTRYDKDNTALLNNSITAIGFGPDSTVWVGTRAGLGKFDGKNWKLYDGRNSDLPHAHITCLAFDSSGNMWVGTRIGMAVYNGFDWTAYYRGVGDMRGSMISALAVDAEGYLWVGLAKARSYHGGVLVFSRFVKLWMEYTVDNSPLPSNDVRALIIDSDRNVWVGTAKGWAKIEGAI